MKKKTQFTHKSNQSVNKS